MKATPVMYEIDNKEEIEKCLNCDKIKCDNCLAFGYRKGKKHVFILDVGKFTEMYNGGYTYRYMSKKLGCHHDTLTKWMVSFGIYAASPRPKLTRKTFEALPSEQRQYLTWKGEAI